MSDREAPGGGEAIPSEAIPSDASQLPAGQLLPNAASYDGFAAFYREHMPRLVSLLVLQGAQLADATDITQETMLRAFRRWSAIEHPAAWARTVACRELVRRFASNPEHPSGTVTDGDLLLPSPAELAEWEARHQILKAMAMLPRRQRQVLAWTLDGYSPIEIARELKIEPSAVRASLMKARRSLSRILKSWEGDQ